MTQRYFPKRQSLPTLGHNNSTKPAYQVYSDTPGTPNQWKQITDRSTAAWDSVYASRHAYSQYHCVDDNGGFFTLSHRQRYTLDNGFDADYGSHIYFPRAVPTKPNEIVGAKDSDKTQLVRYNYATDTETLIRDFSNTISIGNQQGGLSRDGTKAVVLEDNGGSGDTAYLIDLDTGNILSQKNFPSGVYDYITIHPDGNHILEALSAGYDNGNFYGGHSYNVYDDDFNYIRTVGISGHIALGFEFDDTTPIIVGEASWQIVKIDLASGAVTRIAGGPSRFQNNPQSLSLHVAAPLDLPGHFVLTGNDADGPRIVYTVTAEPSDGNTENVMVWGYHNAGVDYYYYGQPQANVNSAGDRVIWASSWNVNTNETAVYDAVETYLCQTKPSNAPVFDDQTFSVNQNAAIGTVVGQLVATDPQNSNAQITSDWRLQHLRNSGFDVSDSGVITVAEASATTSIGVQTTAVIVEGSTAQTANTVTINVTPAAALGTQGNPLTVFTNGGRQSFPALGVAPPGSTLVAVGDLPAEVAAKDGFGHFMYISASYGLGFEARKTVTMANLQPYLTNSNFKGAIFNLFWRDFWLYEPFMQELLNVLRPYGKTMWVEIDDIKFNASSLPLSSAPVPQYIKDNGWTAYSGPSSNAAICSTMATEANCRLALFSDITEIFAKWDNDPALAGLIFPESTRSHAASVGGANVDVADEMIDLYISMYTELKPTFQKTLLVPGLNFVDTAGVSKFEELMDAMVATGGACCFWPDTIETRDPLRPGGPVDYGYPFYEVARAYVDDVMILAGMQTKDIGANRDDCYELALADINTFPRSLQAHGILSWDWHEDYSDWEDQVVAEVATWSGGHNTNYPTALNYKTGTATSAMWAADNAAAEKNLSSIDVTPTNAVDGDTDIVSIWTTTGGAAVENPIYITYSGQAPEVSDGTPTELEFHDYEMGSGAHSVTSSHATRKWSVNNTATDGYSGSGYLEAEGYNTNAETDLGDTQRIPLDDLTAGKTFKAWNRVYAEDGGSDSLWTLKEGVNPSIGGDTYVTSSASHGSWTWILSRDNGGAALILSASDTAFVGSVREENLKWSKTIFIDANETAVPTGKDGFYTLDNKVKDDAFDVAANQIGVTLDVLANDDSGLTLIDIVGAPDHGQGSVDVGNNVVLYSPDNAYIGNDSISYRAQDVEGNYYTAIASITVALSPPPVATAIDVNDNAIGDLVIDFGAHASSPTGLDLTLVHYPEFPQYYTTSAVGMVVTYTSLVTPPISFGGNYSITDSVGNTASNSVSATRLVPDNTNPSPATDTVITPSGVPVVITPLSNDIDPDGHELILLGLVDEPVNGTATITGNSITYVSNDDFGGIEVLTYTVRDIYGASAEGTIKIAVVGPNGVGVKVGGVITATIRVVGK